ncbi:MAG: DnaJ domain-containing protein [Bacteroidales bacterium]|jgi:DnaJ like chaperone protein|nr:DnaJ domain-containing protein [Bacteroidales bacterium]
MVWNIAFFENSKFIRWIAGAVGWLAGGPAFGVTGFIAGAIADNIRVSLWGKAEYLLMGKFTVNLLTVLAAVMQADGKVVRAELNEAKSFLRQYYSEKERKIALKTLRDVLDRHPPLPDACLHLTKYLTFQDKTQLINYLFTLAGCDKPLNDAEQQVINMIATHLGMYDKRLDMSRNETPLNAAYKDLGISQKATNAEIKKAYRSLAVKCHPDKVHLGENEKNRAKEQFQRINKAYKLIKTERKFS